jgi:hypothetical protein
MLFIPKRISFPVGDVLLHIHPKSNKKVDDNRAAKSEKRKINKVKPYFRSSNIKLFAYIGANAKSINLDKVTELLFHVRWFKNHNNKVIYKWLNKPTTVFFRNG